jgi:membrane protease YdiL (CAAX protease family)
MKDQSSSPQSRSLAWELAAVTAALLIVSHILFALRSVAWISKYISIIVAVLFLYVPIFVLWKKKRQVDFLDRSARSFFISILNFFIAAVIIFPPFLGLAHLWQVLIAGKHAFTAASYPGLLSMTTGQLLIIALPEEFFFRGYFQSTIDSIFRQRRRFLGADVGWGWVITAAVFAASHTIVSYQWWHFSIFFPALLFGYLRLRTGSITAPILFHAASNILMDWLTRSYV